MKKTCLPMKTILLALAVYLPVAVYGHPIHVSVCEMEHDKTTARLEITLKLFWDDFEDVLEDRSKEVIRLGTEDEHPDTDRYIVDYFSDKLNLSINGKDADILFQGREMEDIAIWCYLSVEDVEEIATITITNAVMLHWFRDQVNVLHLDCNDKLKSTYFFPGREEETFTFK
jgi:hypothetical protein